MLPERIPNTFLPGLEWVGQERQPMFGFHVSWCVCKQFAPLVEVEVCTFAGSRMEQPEYDWGAICGECLKHYEQESEREEAYYAEAARAESIWEQMEAEGLIPSNATTEEEPF